MMALWRRLSKSCNLYSVLQLWFLVVKWWCCIEVCLVLGLIGLVWCWIEMYWVWFVRCCLRCKCYKDGDNLPMCLIMMWLCKCANLTCINCNERKTLMQFLLRYDDFYIGIDLMTYINLWWLIKALKTFKKGLYLSTEWTRVRSVPSHIEKVWVLIYSWYWRLSCMFPTISPSSWTMFPP